MKKVGGYTVDTQKQLGQGSFATTCQAWLTNDSKTKFACKMINKQNIRMLYSNDDYIIGRIQVQVKTWKQIDHPHIVKFYECIQSHNNLYLFLELCDEGTLQQYINNHKFDKEEHKILKFVKGLIEACLYLFRKGVIHRDIKPDNILLKKGEIKLSDFGLARTIDPQERKKNVWTMTTVGTPVYMAPQVLNQEKYTFKCDVWSIGVTLYQLLAGELPFNVSKKDASPVAILDKIKKNNEEFTHQSFKQFPQLTKMLIPMIEKSPEKRVSIEQLSKMADGLKLA